MSEQFTPGPWSFRYYMEPVGKNDDNFHLFDGPEGDEGGTLLEGAFTFKGTHSEALVYARLIAAAPDFATACGGNLDPGEAATCGPLAWLEEAIKVIEMPSVRRAAMEAEESDDEDAYSEMVTEVRELHRNLRAAIAKARGQ